MCQLGREELAKGNAQPKLPVIDRWEEHAGHHEPRLRNSQMTAEHSLCLSENLLNHKMIRWKQ